MCHRKLVLVSIGLALGALSMPAQAEEMKDPNAPTIYTGYGASLNVGGGLIGFTDNAMRDFAGVGGQWEARFVFGTREDIAIESAYTGGAFSLDALGLDEDAVLISTGLEALARVNILRAEWQPYVVAGVGWRHYAITNSNFNTSDVENDDDLMEIPLGGGVAYRYRGLVVDLRTLFRAAVNDDLVLTNPGEEDANPHSWGGQVTAGFEF